VIKGNFRFFDEKSIVVLVVNFQMPDERYRTLIDTSPPERIQGMSADFGYLAIKMCYKFLEYIHSRTINIDGHIIKISDYETTFFKNLLKQYRTFLLTQTKVKTSLLEKVDSVLKSENQITSEKVDWLLRLFDEPAISDTIDITIEKNRNAVLKKMEFDQ
jgi:hypothetical protein